MLSFFTVATIKTGRAIISNTPIMRIAISGNAKPMIFEPAKRIVEIPITIKLITHIKSTLFFISVSPLSFDL